MIEIRLKLARREAGIQKTYGGEDELISDIFEYPFHVSGPTLQKHQL